ncbi:MAG: rod shape-determining protein MreC [Candidatus Electronema aureum]|jgi:rod shape-determining protein MreC|uniref:Cell shape-determining protein MreC n=1 Tax=Candidatus Electronema aureum TaxID=2005002 RepID=A0A521G5C0_9BACT|nr:MAG: rod shape-determining protein MreC [Candidatus Electronema aureum]
MQRNNRNKKQKDGSEGFRPVLLGGAVLTLLLIFLVFIFGSQEFGPVYKLVLDATGPLQKGASQFAVPFRSMREKYLDLLTVREEKERLLQELQKCRTAAYANRGAVALNARLRKLLEFKESSGLPTVTARIVGKDPSPWFRSVIIDRGLSDGVDKGMPVVTGEGIVGQVYAASANYAKVLLTISPSSAIDVLLQDSRVRGILKGTGGSTYRLEYVLKTIEVAKGDHVVTAGYGGMFPPGLPVGIVSEVTRNRRGMFLEIEVVPAVDFSTLENLLVIEQKKKEFRPQSEAGYP